MGQVLNSAGCHHHHHCPVAGEGHGVVAPPGDLAMNLILFFCFGESPTTTNYTWSEVASVS